MDMKTIEVLSAQHQDVLAQLATLDGQLRGGGAADLAAFALFLQQEVMQHFTLEEDALFPVLGRHLGVEQGPLAVMNSEHQAFRELLGGLGTALGTQRLDMQRQYAAEIIELLRSHIMKEDDILFPMAQRILGEAEQREVDGRAAARNTSGAPAV
jgi:regulator of cell morphogenesis and NO signaling